MAMSTLLCAGRCRAANWLQKGNDMAKEIKESTFECQRDGLTIRGTEFRPEGDNLPIAIVSHGFMGTQEMERARTMYLAEMGYAAYC